VVSGTPIDLAACLAETGIATPPIRHVGYDLDDVTKGRLAELLAPHIASWKAGRLLT
jgi:hypothetical protein